MSINLMSHLQTEELDCHHMILCKMWSALMQRGGNKQTNECIASDFKHSSSPNLSRWSLPHSSSILSVLSWTKSRHSLWECQSTWTMVKSSRTIKANCKAHASIATFLTKCWGQGSEAGLSASSFCNLITQPSDQQAWYASLTTSVSPLSHSLSSLTTSKQNISEEHFRKCVFFCLQKTLMRRKVPLFCIRRLSTSRL